MSKKFNERNTKIHGNNEILNMLLKDPRKSASEIADELKTYRQKVWREIKKLEKKNAIWGYTAVIDEGKIGWKSFIILIKMKPISKKQVDLQIKRLLNNEPEKLSTKLVDFFYINGTYDWIIIFTAEDWATARKYYDSLRIGYREFLREKPELTEIIFPIVRYGKKNPEIEKLRDFVPPEDYEAMEKRLSLIYR